PRRQRRDWAPSMHLGEKAAPESPVGALERAQRMLLAILINHPEIFDRVEETLGKISFSEAHLDAMRQELISVLLKDADLESEGVKSVLRERGFAESLDVLFRDPLIRSNRVIRAGTPAEKYRSMWDENVALLKHMENAPEVDRFRNTGDDGIAEDDWERMRALIEATMPGHRE
ncbi:MAG: hypothetical protein ACE5GT_13475, partial [Rhodospirillales bacterium]